MIIANIILKMNNGFSVKCWQKAFADTGAKGARAPCKIGKNREREERKEGRRKRGEKKEKKVRKNLSNPHRLRKLGAESPQYFEWGLKYPLATPNLYSHIFRLKKDLKLCKII